MREITKNDKAPPVGDTVLFMPGYIHQPVFCGIVAASENQGYIHKIGFAVKSNRRRLMASETLIRITLPFRMVLTEKKIFDYLPPARIYGVFDGHQPHVELQYTEKE